MHLDVAHLYCGETMWSGFGNFNVLMWDTASECFYARRSCFFEIFCCIFFTPYSQKSSHQLIQHKAAALSLSKYLKSLLFTGPLPVSAGRASVLPRWWYVALTNRFPWSAACSFQPLFVLWRSYLLVHLSSSVSSSSGLSPQETLLHFSARRGLSRVTRFLLRQPGAREALQLVNKEGHSPAAVAAQRGHEHLRELLTKWVQLRRGHGLTFSCCCDLRWVHKCSKQGKHILIK